MKLRMALLAATTALMLTACLPPPHPGGPSGPGGPGGPPGGPPGGGHR